jgi:hypothetical protein
MQRHGKTVESMFEADTLADRIVRIEEALGCSVPQGFGDSINQSFRGVD